MSRRAFLPLLLVVACWLSAPAAGAAGQPLKALIVDGQNNHADWPKVSFMVKSYLEASGLFTVDMARTKYTWQGEKWLADYSLPGFETEATPKAKADPDFRPQFANYDVVINNFGFNAAPWPQETQQDFVAYMQNGGGLVVIHAADNSFGDWDEYNQMIGVGGWGGRDEKSGPFVYLNGEGEVVRDESAGKAGQHGPQHPFAVEVRDTSHPITKDMPVTWMHAQDELYEKLRGPAAHMRILATSQASPEFKGTGHHVPMLMVIEYGKGRVFHTPLGHADYSCECVGFITLVQRGAEWAATGKVTQPLPADFPTADATSSRSFSAP